MMAERYRDVWSVSASPMPVALAQGGRRAKAWAVRFGVAGVALFAASAFLLMGAGHRAEQAAGRRLSGRAGRG